LTLTWAGRALAEKYVATVPQIFDLWQDPQERYDLFMNNFTERTWMAVPNGCRVEKANGDT
jgi:arylsulfatase